MAKDKSRIEELFEDADFDVRRPMSKDDWEEIEQWYVDAVNSIVIPEDIDPEDLIQLNYQLSKLYTKARFDYMYIKRQYEKLKRQMKRAEKQAYLAVKNLGKNDKERESLICKYLEDNKLYGYPVNMYDAIDIYEERALFMEAVLDDIKDKSGRLISNNGALKLDAELDA
jgi:uncharacterized protein YozE (UPF0346 family)